MRPTRRMHALVHDSARVCVCVCVWVYVNPRYVLVPRVSVCVSLEQRAPTQTNTCMDHAFDVPRFEYNTLARSSESSTGGEDR